MFKISAWISRNNWISKMMEPCQCHIFQLKFTQKLFLKHFFYKCFTKSASDNNIIAFIHSWHSINYFHHHNHIEFCSTLWYAMKELTMCHTHTNCMFHLYRASSREFLMFKNISWLKLNASDLKISVLVTLVVADNIVDCLNVK